MEKKKVRFTKDPSNAKVDGKKHGQNDKKQGKQNSARHKKRISI